MNKLKLTINNDAYVASTLLDDVVGNNTHLSWDQLTPSQQNMFIASAKLYNYRGHRCSVRDRYPSFYEYLKKLVKASDAKRDRLARQVGRAARAV